MATDHVSDPDPMPPLIDMRQVTMSFGPERVVLSDVNAEVHRGEFIALLGPSGCGKSTLLRLVAGLLTATSGSLTVGQLPPVQSRRSSLRLAFVFQEPNLLPWRSVAANIALPLELGGASRDEQTRSVAEILPIIGLTADDARKRAEKEAFGKLER